MMNTDRRRVRALLLAVFVPVFLLIGVLASSVLGSSGHSGPVPRPVTTVPEAHGTPDAGAHGGAASARPASALDGEFVPPGAERIDVGHGAQSAAIFRSERAGHRPGPVVIFLHGWAALDPARYGPWIDHIVEEGTTVIYPAYQVRPARDTISPLPNAIAGIRAALADVQLAPGRLVVAGHSAGGALAADYAAVAGQSGLPEPAAVFSVYPGRKLSYLPVPIPTVDLSVIPHGTRLIVLAGARDTAVGSGTAREIVATATNANATFETVRDPTIDQHSAPRHDNPAARETFWHTLDDLVAETAHGRLDVSGQ
jgi:acetyl esterase/lipase